MLVEQTIERLHSWMGVSTSDSRSTHLDFLFKIQPPIYVEDYDGNPLHFLLIAGTAAVVFMSRRSTMPGIIVVYSLAIAAGFFLLCLIVKWNPFTSRTQLPLFVLWSPVVGLILSRFHSDRLSYALAAILFVCTVPWILYNARHPIIAV